MLARGIRQHRSALAPLMVQLVQEGTSVSGSELQGCITNNRSSSLLLDGSPSCSGRPHGYGRPHSSSASPSGPQPEASASKPETSGSTLQASLAEQFRRDPHAASQALASALTPAQRAVLAAALTQHTDVRQLDEKYWEELFKAHDDTAGDSPGALSRSEFQAAMLAHTSLTENQARAPPSSGALRMVFFCSAIPFVAFGFLDNAIMLVAGEEIDHLIGARLGLSTLASAGLGNAVADVIGVGAAKNIEQAVRWLPFVKEPKLSKYQNSLPSTQRAKSYGAMVGVLVGCLLGLSPLLLQGSFFCR